MSGEAYGPRVAYDPGYPLWRRVLRDLPVVLTLTGLVGTGIYNSGEMRATAAVTQTAVQLNQTQEDRLRFVEQRLSHLEGRDSMEHPHGGPPGACYCVDETPPGREFSGLLCSLAAECDARASKACETLHPTFRCKALE